MVRIALLTHSFPSREHPYISSWVQKLYEAGIDITVLTEQTGWHTAEESDIGLAKRVKLLNSVNQPLAAKFQPLKKRPVGSHLGEAVRALRIIGCEHPDKRRTVIRKLFEYAPVIGERYDILHYNAPQIAIRRWELGPLLGARRLVSFRGQDFSFHPDRYDRILEEADYLHFISEHLVQEAQKRGYKGGKHTLIRPAIDTDFYHPNPQPRNEFQPPFTLFTSARFSWTKGWEFALQAIALLVNQGFDINYYIAGDGDFREAVLYTISELNLSDRVYLLGWISPEEVRNWLWKTDIYVLASVDEAFNNSVIQAQACGVPVVCSDAGGLPENIENGITGLIARRRDAWDLAMKIASLLKCPDRAAKMSELARRRAVTLFSMNRMIAEFDKLYQDIYSGVAARS